MERSIQEYQQFIAAISSPITRLQLGREKYKALEQARASELTTFAAHLNTILALYPDYSTERDDRLVKLVNDQAFTFSDAQAAGKYFVINRDPRKDKSILFTTAAIETYRDLITYLDARQKAELTLWTLNMRTKPYVVDVFEQSLGSALPNFQTALQNATPTDKTILLEHLLAGEDGIFSSGDPQAEKFFTDYFFCLIAPTDNQDALPKLKALYDATMSGASAQKKLRIIGSLVNAKDNNASFAHIVRTFLDYFGVVGRKTGQYLATRTSILPQDIQGELSELRDNAEPFAKQEVFETVSAVFGVADPGQIFPRIGERLGTASIKQVYDVLLPDGREEVIKVLRPSVPKEIREDVATLTDVLRFVNEYSASFNNIKLPDGMVDEIHRTLLEELNTEREVRLQEQFRSMLNKRWPERSPDGYRITVPAIIHEYTRGPVVCEQKAGGKSLGDLIEEHCKDVPRIAELLVEDLFKQIFDDSIYHADLHDKNIKVNGKDISLLDVGLVGTLSDENKCRLFETFTALYARDRVKIKELFAEFYLETPKQLQKPLSISNLDQIADDLFTLQPGADISWGKLLNNLLVSVNKHNLEMPKEFYMLINCFTKAEYLFKCIPQERIAGIAMQYFPRYAGMHHGSKRHTQKEIEQFLASIPAIQDTTNTASKSLPKIPELWKTDCLEKGTRIRDKRGPHEEYLLQHLVSLKETSNLNAKKTGDIEMRTYSIGYSRDSLEVFIDNKWTTLRDLQIVDSHGLLGISGRAETSKNVPLEQKDGEKQNAQYWLTHARKMLKDNERLKAYNALEFMLTQCKDFPREDTFSLAEELCSVTSRLTEHNLSIELQSIRAANKRKSDRIARHSLLTPVQRLMHIQEKIAVTCELIGGILEFYGLPPSRVQIEDLDEIVKLSHHEENAYEVRNILKQYLERDEAKEVARKIFKRLDEREEEKESPEWLQEMVEQDKEEAELLLDDEDSN